MKPFESRSDLSRYVAAARSDLPDAATLERAFGSLATAGARESSVEGAAPAADGGGARRAQLVKLGGTGLAVVLAAAGALFFGRPAKVSNPGLVPRPVLVADPLRASQTRSEPVPVVEAAPPPVVAPVAVPPSAPGPRRRARRLDPEQTRAQPQEPEVRAVQSPPSPTRQPLTAADVDAESALIESARRMLHVKPARTLELSAEHERTFGAGLLGLEREALAIHALALLGRDREARARLQAFSRAHPRSIHVTRLQRVLGSVDVAGDDAVGSTP